jgi:hypothetical protein
MAAQNTSPARAHFPSEFLAKSRPARIVAAPVLPDKNIGLWLSLVERLVRVAIGQILLNSPTSSGVLSTEVLARGDSSRVIPKMPKFWLPVDINGGYRERLATKSSTRDRFTQYSP